MLCYAASQVFCLKFIFLGTPINLFSFTALQALQKLGEVADLRKAVAHQKWKGLQELEMAMVGTPASQLVDLVAVRVNGANDLASSPSGAPSLVWRGDILPLLLVKPQREPITLPPQHCWHS